MPNNFKTVHSSGIIKLEFENRTKKTEYYTSVRQRKAIMKRWESFYRYKNYCVVLIPNWDLWNGKID